jgi:hypothetical protein
MCRARDRAAFWPPFLFADCDERHSVSWSMAYTNIVA